MGTPITSVGVVVFCVMTVLRAPGWLLMLLAIVVSLNSVLAVGDTAARIYGRRRAERRLPTALRAYKPTYLIYWFAPTGSRQQLAMCLPYLERQNRSFIIVLRNPESFAEIIRSRPVQCWSCAMPPSSTSCWFRPSRPPSSSTVRQRTPTCWRFSG